MYLFIRSKKVLMHSEVLNGLSIEENLYNSISMNTHRDLEYADI